MSADQPLVVTVEADDGIHLHPARRLLLAEVIAVLAQDPMLLRDLRDAVDAARALDGSTASERVQLFWTRERDRALDGLERDSQLSAALTLRLTPDEDGTAWALSDLLDDAQSTVRAQRLHRVGLHDEPDRDSHLGDLGERPALTGGAS